MGFVLGDSLDTKPGVFPCKVAPAGDERYLGWAAVADRPFWCVIGASSLFCNEWCVVCTSHYAVLESWVADRSGMAA